MASKRHDRGSRGHASCERSAPWLGRPTVEVPERRRDRRDASGVRRHPGALLADDGSAASAHPSRGSRGASTRPRGARRDEAPTLPRAARAASGASRRSTVTTASAHWPSQRAAGARTPRSCAAWHASRAGLRERVPAVVDRELPGRDHARRARPGSSPPAPRTARPSRTSSCPRSTGGCVPRSALAMIDRAVSGRSARTTSCYAIASSV